MARGVTTAPWWVATLLLPLGCYTGAESAIQDTDSADTAIETGDGDPGGGTDPDSDGDTDGDDGVPAGCEPDDVPTAALVRTNRAGIINAIRDVFGETVVDDLGPVLDAIPALHVGEFSTELAPPSYAEVSAQMSAAFSVATHLTRNDTALIDLAACLPDVPASADAATDPCLVTFIDDYGSRILRRPLSDDDRQRFAQDYAIGAEHSNAEGVATLLTAMLIDPDFLYDRIVGEGEGDVLELTPHETAARLARVLWNSVPDDALRQAADAGLDETTLRAQAERMLEDPRARVALQGFFFDWMELEAVPFASADAIPDNEARDALKDAMGGSLMEFASATVLDGDGTYADLLMDRTAYIDDENLAAIYGVATSAGPTELPADRAGLLTRAGFIATQEIPGTNAGHLIKRGARLSAFICRPLPLPDADNFPQEDPAEPGDNPTQGIRERFAEATAEATCAACHIQLDGLGAPLGHFGSLGEWIDQETVGNVDLTIDTASEVIIDGQPVAIDDAVTLSEALAYSEEGPHCLAENMARNMLGRELTDDDACLVQEFANALTGEDGAPASVRDALLDFVVSDRFRRVRTP